MSNPSQKLPFLSLCVCVHAYHAVSGQTRETEAVKLMSIRAGLLDMSKSWELLGNKCILLAQAQKV